jgi:predicted dehydrogenase
MDRRTFLKGSLAGAATLATAPHLKGQEAKKYRTALIGTGWWGMNILNCAMEAGESRVVALCDVDQRFLNSSAEKATKLNGDVPRKYKDYRELLSKEKPEIVIVATPDHWHPLIAIAAVEAGAHVYVEKPIGHTIREGRAMVGASRKHGRIVQVGTHRRISPHNVSGMQFLKSGKAGKIGMVRAFVQSPSYPRGTVADSAPPPELDWDMYCGPAPLHPYNRRIHPRGFRSYLDFANGTIGDWGIHWFDQIMWWTEEKYPRRIYSSGRRFSDAAGPDAPDTQVATLEFESFLVTWEDRQYAGNGAEKADVGCYFYGTEGVFHMGWMDGWTFYPSRKSQPPIHAEPKLNLPDQQNIKELWTDFLQNIKADKPPLCDIEIGHRSTNCSLLAMISYKLGRSLEWDGEKEIIRNDEAANRLLSRPYRSPWKYPEA